jgi:FAD/FMN-containing dehydrogenase
MDEESLQQFSHDQSIYEIKPLAVVFPEDDNDARKLVEFARREGIPLTARGGGSGTAGGALGRGVVIVLPKNDFWTRINGFSVSGATARVSAAAGAYHNDLQKFLKDRGYFLPADVTSAAISRIGGNIATRASGPHALRYGSIDRFLESVEFITPEGELVDTADEATIPQRLKSGFEDLGQRMRQDEGTRAKLESRKGLKTASGYNMSVLLADQRMGRQIALLLAGSAGTLGLITRASLRAEVYEPPRAIVVLSFEELSETGRAVNVLRQLDVAAIELISRETLQIIRDQTGLSDAAARFLPAAHLLFVEVTGAEAGELIQRINSLIVRNGFLMSVPALVVQTESEIGELWNVRKQILWRIEHPKPGLRAPAVVNDVGVPPGLLAPFIDEAQSIFRKHGLTACIYGHAGNGNLHLRPLFDTALPDLALRIRRLADDIYEAVIRYGGTVTAEHGMGRLRAPYLKREWGEALYRYMLDVKKIFDPADIFNPGVMFSDVPITDNMRKDLLGP